jgi:hypothetical protein
MDLYEEICQGISFSDESGKIRSIHLLSIRYFAYFVAKCVLARKTANKLSSYDLAFILVALRQDKTYNLGALMAFRLAANCEKGGVCGGLIASHLLALHGVVPHNLDIQFPIERLDLNSMIQHKFVSSWAGLNNFSYELTFFKKSGWRVVKSEHLVNLSAPLLFNLDVRKDGHLWRMSSTHIWRSTLSTWRMMEMGPKITLSSPPTLRSSHTSNLIMIMGLLFLLLHESLISIMLMMIHQPGVIISIGIDLHLGQKPKLGGGIPTTHSSIHHIQSGLCISMFRFLSFSLLFLFCFYFPKHKKTKNISVVSLCLLL